VDLTQKSSASTFRPLNTACLRTVVGDGTGKTNQKFLGLANAKEACLFPRDMNRIDTLFVKINATVRDQNEKFEGPLQLLLTLITSARCTSPRSRSPRLPTLISLTLHSLKNSRYTNRRSSSWSLRPYAHQVTIAPAGIAITDDEKSEIENLEERLRLYAIYQEAGKKLAEAFGTREMLCRREGKSPLSSLLRKQNYRAFQPFAILMTC